MTHLFYKYKKQLFIWLAVVLFLSGIQTGSAISYGSTKTLHTSPHTPAIQHIVSWLYHDVSTEENLGTRSVRSILDCCIRSRGKGFCRIPDPIYPVSKSDVFLYAPASAAKLYQQTREPYALSWIIRYIHDQDGEKDSTRPLI